MAWYLFFLIYLFYCVLKLIFIVLIYYTSIQGISAQQLEAIKVAIERSIISRVYMYAMFPNGDGDVSRDEYVK